MKIIAVVSQKGGSGKTTVSVHLAACAVREGKAVALLDLDPQGSSYSWFSSRSSSNEFAAVKTTHNELPAILKNLENAKADLVIIDTAPHSNSSAAAAVELANFVLVACRPSRFDLEAVVNTMDIIHLTKPTPHHAVLINCAPPVGNLAEEARAALVGQGYPVLNSVICNRVAYNYAVTDGRSVDEYEPGGKAAKEISNLYEELLQVWKYGKPYFYTEGERENVA